MNDSVVEIEIPLLVPGVETAQDGCVERLERTLRQRKGIRRAHVERTDGRLVLCLHYDPGRLSVDDVQREAQRVGADLAGRYGHAVVRIEGMDCSDCVTVIEHGLSRLDGMLAATASYTGQTVHVEYDGHRLSRRAIEKQIHQLGYTVPLEGRRGWLRQNRELLRSVLAGVLLVAGWLAGRVFALTPAQVLPFFVGAYLAGGYDIARHALRALRERQLDTDVLMIAAALGAAALGQLAEGALLLFLFSLGHALEERALDRARRAIRGLADLTPRTALVRRDGGEREVPVEQLALGDVVMVAPGVRVPVDGVVRAGQSALDQSPVTGESIPVDKRPGDPVYAGSVNGEGALELEVTRLARDGTLARVARMVEEAQAQKSPTQLHVERFMAVFVPLVLAVTVIVIVIPPLLGVAFAESFARAMTLLVAASPCALALGTPAAILAAVAVAAQEGVLVKGGAHLENLGWLRAVAFDKTGTVTKGQPEVVEIVSLDPATPEADLLGLAAAVERRSAHPLASAVTRAAKAGGLVLPAIEIATAVTGRGMRAVVGGREVHVGSLKLLDEAGIELSSVVRGRVAALEEQGRTTMVVSVGGKVVGFLGLADTVRPDAKAAVRALGRLGVKETVMLTGDNRRVAARVAAEVGVSTYRAGLLPQDKVEAIGQLLAVHGVVAMVGDGVNDAPALARATVGIAMGGAGTDVALETADVALMADDLTKLPYAVSLGRRTRAIVRQNLLVSLGVIGVLVVLALGGLTGIAGAVVLHEGSTMIVVLNALRLLRYRAAARAPCWRTGA